MQKLKEELKATNKKAGRLKAKMEQRKNEVLNAKSNGVAECKGSNEYQMALGYAMTFWAKEKIKIKRMLQRAHNINLSYLEGIETKPTFFGLASEEDEKGEEVE